MVAESVPHPVKVERHDTQAGLHHTNTGIRPVQAYRETPHGLFVTRPFAKHPRIRHWQAHLLPDLHLVVCRYDFHGAREHDYYVDVVTITRHGDVWTVRDLYLDIVVHDGLGAEVVDTDELLAAHRAGLIPDAELYHSLEVAHHTLSTLARARYDLAAWAATHNLTLDWNDVLSPSLPNREHLGEVRSVPLR